MNLNAMLSRPGIYMINTPRTFFFVEVLPGGECHQLKPDTFERDGVLAYERWNLSGHEECFGPLARPAEIPAPAEGDRADALQDRAYVAGAQAGFALGSAGDSAGLEKLCESRREAVAVLRAANVQPKGTVPPSDMQRWVQAEALVESLGWTWNAARDEWEAAPEPSDEQIAEAIEREFSEKGEWPEGDAATVRAFLKHWRKA